MNKEKVLETIKKWSKDTNTKLHISDIEWLACLICGEET